MDGTGKQRKSLEDHLYPESETAEVLGHIMRKEGSEKLNLTWHILKTREIGKSSGVPT